MCESLMDRPRWAVLRIYVAGLKKRKFDFLKPKTATHRSKSMQEKQQTVKDMILNNLKSDLLANQESDNLDADDSLAEEAMQNEADFFKQLFSGMVSITEQSPDFDNKMDLINCMLDDSIDVAEPEASLTLTEYCEIKGESSIHMLLEVVIINEG